MQHALALNCWLPAACWSWSVGSRNDPLMMLEPSLGLSADSYHRMHAGDGEDVFALPLVSPDALEYVFGGRQVYLRTRHTVSRRRRRIGSATM